MTGRVPRTVLLCAMICALVTAMCGCGQLGDMLSDEQALYTVAPGSDGTVSVTSYQGMKTELSVPAVINGQKVTAIAGGAFSGKNAIKEVSLPESVVTVGAGAFSGCTSLESIGLENVGQIDEGAFRDCSSLTEADLSSAIDIGAEAFSGCSAMTSVTLGDSKNVHVGERCFAGCSSLTELRGGSSAKMEAAAFARCVSLAEVEFDEKARLAGEVFSGCTMLYTARFTGDSLPQYLDKWESAIPTFPAWTTIEYSPSFLENNRRIVYSDSGDKSRLFTLVTPGEGGGGKAAAMNESCPIDTANGKECVDCVMQLPEGGSAAGWQFMNSAFDDEGHQVPANGYYPGCGTDLTGAKELVFYARTENGGERVTFFVAGCARDGNTPAPSNDEEDDGEQTNEGAPPYPDSTDRIERSITLTDKWQRYSIDLSDKDLSYIQCGFGFVCSRESGGRTVELYLDDIYFEGDFS